MISRSLSFSFCWSAVTAPSARSRLLTFVLSAGVGLLLRPRITKLTTTSADDTSTATLIHTLLLFETTNYQYEQPVDHGVSGFFWFRVTHCNLLSMLSAAEAQPQCGAQNSTAP